MSIRGSQIPGDEILYGGA